METENKMAVIELENIQKSYADGNQMHHVLSHLDLSVNSKEFVAILGPSGSGKSTLLAVAGLLLSADAGRIRIGAKTSPTSARSSGRGSAWNSSASSFKTTSCCPI